MVVGGSSSSSSSSSGNIRQAGVQPDLPLPQPLLRGRGVQDVRPGGYMQPMPQSKPEPLFGEELF